jgi:hypothetical protein
MSSAFAQFVRGNPPPTKSTTPEVAILPSLDLLEQLLVEENAIFESGKPADHAAFIDRKNQILRELMVHQRMSPDSKTLALVADRVANLRPLIERNKNLLAANISALGEVANIMKAAVLDGEADGTYSKQRDLRFDTA